MLIHENVLNMNTKEPEGRDDFGEMDMTQSMYHELTELWFPTQDLQDKIKTVDSTAWKRGS